MIIKYLKNNLRPRSKAPRYIQFRLLRKNTGNDLHHFIGSYMGGKKLNDYLLAEISAALHNEITNKRRATEYEQLDMLKDCIEGLIDYIEMLENETDKLNKIVKAAVESRKVIVELINDEETNT